MTKPTPPRERIQSKTNVTESGCWEWNGYRTRQGYGKATVDGVHGTLVHRWAYEVFVGPIPPGLEIDHLCSNRACCNPEHLEPVSHDVNVARGRRAQQTHCKRGHPLSGDNIWLDSIGRRRCRECHNAYSRDAYRRRRNTSD